MWIIVGWYNDDWWTKQDVPCQGHQLLEAAANMIETLPLPLSTSHKPTISSRVDILDLHVASQPPFSWSEQKFAGFSVLLIAPGDLATTKVISSVSLLSLETKLGIHGIVI